MLDLEELQMDAWVSWKMAWMVWEFISMSREGLDQPVTPMGDCC